jgi:hypothetical protein
MPFVGKYMKLEIMLSEIRQSHKDTYYMFSWSPVDTRWKKNQTKTKISKVMKVKGGLLKKWKRKGKWGGGKRSNRRGEMIKVHHVLV